MDLRPFIAAFRDDLAAAAQVGDDDVRRAAERLLASVEPAMRLTLMDVLAEATADISATMADLGGGSVEVRLRDREPEFVVTVPQLVPPTQPLAAAEPPAAEADDEGDGSTARITLRLPQSVKDKAEELASRGGQSLNTWIVQVLRGATRQGAIHIDLDLSSLPFGDSPPARQRGGPRRMTGWV